MPYDNLQACKIVEGQRYTKRLNEKQITALLKVTCQRPRDREHDILQVFLCVYMLYFIFREYKPQKNKAMIMCTYVLSDSLLEEQTVQHNAYDEDPYAKEFGLRISEKLASVEARILPAPWVIIYGFPTLFLPIFIVLVFSVNDFGDIFFPCS